MRVLFRVREQWSRSSVGKSPWWTHVYQSAVWRESWAKRQASHSPGDLWSYTNLWSWTAETKSAGTNGWNKTPQLLDRYRETFCNLKETQSRVTANHIERSQLRWFEHLVRICLGHLPREVFSGKSNWEEALGQIQNILERLCLSTALRTPPGRARQGGWREGGLGFPL